MTEAVTLESLDLSINVLATAIGNLSKKMDSIKDLLVEISTNKIENTIIQQQTKIQKPLKKKEFKIDSYHEDILNHLKEVGEETDGIIETFNKEEINQLSDVLSENSSKNVRNCFVWCYSHINDTRNKTLRLPNVKKYVMELYDKKDVISKYKNVIELLKYEANSIHSNFKDEPFFKAHIEEIKSSYH